MDRTLILDADDTLWENNIHFEAAIERFCEIAASYGLPAEEVREALMRIERRNVAQFGYGSRVFVQSLRETLEGLSSAPATRTDRLRLAHLGRQVREMPIEFLPGVLSTLPRLRERYRLILFTKGDPPEQRLKVERSGVAPLFHHVEITTEKDREAYARLVVRHRLHPPSTWMVGNSPRSDINPALAAGLNAVLIPHPRTWELEHEEVDGESERLRVIRRFEELLQIF